MESYRDYVDYLTSETQDENAMLYGVEPQNIYYCFLDFNEDGVTDFCWGVGGEKISEIITLEDGRNVKKAARLRSNARYSIELPSRFHMQYPVAGTMGEKK